MTRDHFAFDAGRRAEIGKRLSSIAQAEPSDEEGDVYIFLRRGNALHKDWETTILGRALLGEKELVVETNSKERADSVRARIEQTCKGMLSHRIREHADPQSLRAPKTTDTLRQPPIAPAEADQIVREYKARHYQRWVDEPLPALGGLTPRQASRKRGLRGQVDALLKDIEHAENRLPGGPQVDLTSVRAELGLH